MYADDDWAVAALAELLGYTENATFFRNRAQTHPFTIFNNATGFMEARNANGSWAGQDEGWTEGDMWAYTFDVIQDVPSLIAHRGGNASFVAFLDEHFDGGHNDQTNEVSARSGGWCGAADRSARSRRTTYRTCTRSRAQHPRDSRASVRSRRRTTTRAWTGLLG